MSNDESTLRARNIQRPIPPELDNARALMRELEQLEHRKASAQMVFGQTPPPPAKCLICKQDRFYWNGSQWKCANCEPPKKGQAR